MLRSLFGVCILPKTRFKESTFKPSIWLGSKCDCPLRRAGGAGHQARAAPGCVYRWYGIAGRCAGCHIADQFSRRRYPPAPTTVVVRVPSPVPAEASTQLIQPIIVETGGASNGGGAGLFAGLTALGGLLSGVGAMAVWWSRLDRSMGRGGLTTVQYTRQFKPPDPGAFSGNSSDHSSASRDETRYEQVVPAMPEETATPGTPGTPGEPGRL